ncbi:MAG: hypothetical protein ACPLKP_01205 [Microgenomates group bacterium]
MKKIKKFIKKYQLVILIFTIFGILFDIFLVKFISDLVILFLAGLWILTIKLYKFEGRDSVKVALGLLILCPILLILKKDFLAEKSAIWVYVFLVIGVIQMMFEVLREEKVK